MKIGYFLSCEEWGPKGLISQAVKAQEAGFEGLWISDHYHPWNDEQGHSSFVLGDDRCDRRRGARHACDDRGHLSDDAHPSRGHRAGRRHHRGPAGREVRIGVGSGEALNEHIFGDAWPNADERLEMLEESIEVIRTLWQGGAQSHRGRHYRVEHARVYDLPDEPTPILISGFGPKAIELAGRVGDGFCTVQPDGEAVRSFRSHGGDGKLVQGGTKVCWGRDERAALAHVARLWPNEGLPGELPQILPTPEHFEQAAELVTPEMLADAVVCGPDIERHVSALQEYADAGFDELYVNQIGPDQDAFFEVYSEHVLPRLR
jgi:G6PDH family F420-dependent oxidoreductase